MEMGLTVTNESLNDLLYCRPASVEESQKLQWMPTKQDLVQSQLWIKAQGLTMALPQINLPAMPTAAEPHPEIGPRV